MLRIYSWVGVSITYFNKLVEFGNHEKIYEEMNKLTEYFDNWTSLETLEAAGT